VAETLPEPGFAADAPRPPIGFTIDLPDHWTVLNLDPLTWDGWLDAFLDARLAGRPTARTERSAARSVLLDLLRRLHGDGVFLAGILVGEVPGHPVSASATLAWRHPDLGGDEIDLEGLRQVFLRAPAAPGEDREARRVEPVELRSGAAVKLVSKETAPVPTLRTLRIVSVTQYFVRVPCDGWMGVITATTGVRELEAAVEGVADAMAQSLTFPSPSA
jgi:hypothetical protein